MKPERIPNGEINPKSKYVLGIDPARTGSDETALVILEQLPANDNIFISYMESGHVPDLTTTLDRVIFLDKFYNFDKIYIDETGLGAGLSDILKNKLGNRVVGVWYTQKIKVEIFNNLKLLMMRRKGKLYIPDYKTMRQAIVKKMFFQFLSISQTFKDAAKLPKISHDNRTHDDIINALALAATHFQLKKIKRSYGLGGFTSTR